MPTTTLPANKATAGGASMSGSGPSAIAQAQGLCAQIVRIQRAFGSSELAGPQPGQTAADTISANLTRLRSALQGLTGGSQRGSGIGSLGPMVGDVDQALSQGQAAVDRLSAGSLLRGGRAWDRALQDLERAREAGRSAHLQSCA